MNNIKEPFRAEIKGIKSGKIGFAAASGSNNQRSISTHSAIPV